jgi:hypothetical protein
MNVAVSPEGVTTAAATAAAVAGTAACAAVVTAVDCACCKQLLLFLRYACFLISRTLQ